MIVGEKMYLEEQVGTLDGVVDRFSKRIETLVEEKKALETQVEIGRGQLEAKEMRRKALVEDVAWLLHNGIFHVLDKVVESVEFPLGVRRMKVACMAAGVEGRKQVIMEHISTKKFVSGESSALLEHTQAMHAGVKSFLETYYSSYLHLGELDMKGLRHLCSNPDVEERHPKGSNFGFGPSSTCTGM